MDSSRLRSRATQEEERAGHGGSHRTGPYERYQNITKTEETHFLMCTFRGKYTKTPSWRGFKRTGKPLRKVKGKRERLLTHPGASGEKRRKKRGEIIPLDLMD